MESKNLWAPWRIGYVQGLAEKSDCFICDYLKRPDDDAQNLVLWRSSHCVMLLNRFPYNNGHLLIAPTAHKADLQELTDAEMLELMQMVARAQQTLTKAIKPQGFNVGLNLGRCAGAGLPGHLHFHIVPRWEGDTNFMAITGEVRVIPQALADSYQLLRTAAANL